MVRCSVHSLHQLFVANFFVAEIEGILLKQKPSTMYRHNDGTCPTMLHDLLDGKRSKGPREPIYGKPVNQPPSIIARYPNIEMSQTSQLSMDSYLKSQPAPFADSTARQPSTSTRSSSSTTREHRQQCCYHQNDPSSSCDYGGDREGTHNYLQQYSQSSLSESSVKSASRKKNRINMNKTCFARVDHEKENLGRGQGSFPTSRSSSSARLVGSHYMSHDAYQLQTRNSIARRRSMNSGSSSCNPQKLRRQDSHFSRRGNSERALLLKCDEQRKRSPNKQKISPSVPILGPIFAKIATSRKALEIPYPPIKSQPQDQDLSSFRQSEEGRLFGSGTAAKNNNMCLKKESVPEQGKITSKSQSDRTSGASERFSNDVAQFVLLLNSQSTTNDGGSNTSASGYHSNILAQRNTMESSSNDESVPYQSERNIRQENHRIAVKLGDLSTLEESMGAFEMRLRKLFSDMEREATANFHKVSQTITGVSKSKLVEKAKALQEVMKVEIDEKANAIQEATQSNLKLLGQEKDRAEKAIKTLVASKTRNVKEAASVSVQNIRACTESGLAKLKRFTESWFGNNCRAVASRLKPFLRLSPESNTSSHENFDIGDGPDSNIHQRETKGHSVVESPGSNQMRKNSLTPFDESPKDGPDEKLSSSLKVEITPTQDFKNISAGKRIDMALIRPLRTSKRTKQPTKPKGDTNLDGIGNDLANVTTPTNDNNDSRKLSSISSRERIKFAKGKEGIPHLTVAMNDNALCVTPIEGNIRSKMKKSNPTPISHKFNVKPKRIEPLRSKRRKRTKPQTPLKTKRVRVESYIKGGGSVPSEVFAFDDINLSPLQSQSTDLVASNNNKKNPKRAAYGFRSASKSRAMLAKKRKSTKLQTYNKRKKTFDVTDDDIFSF